MIIFLLFCEKEMIMKKFVKYILYVITVVYYLFMFIMPIVTNPNPNISLWLFIPVYIILFPLIGVPVMMMWKIFDDWDKPWTGADPRSWF